MFVIVDKILGASKEPFRNSSEGMGRKSEDKSKSLSTLVDISKTLTSELEIATYGKKAPNTDQPSGGIYQQILEELEDSMELAQLASILSFSSGKMKYEDAKKLGEKIEKFKMIRSACKESVEFVQSDRH